MTKGTITKELFTKCLIPLSYCAIIIFTLWSMKVQYNPDIMKYIIVLLAFGLPIGIRKMFIWLVPTRFSGIGEGTAIIMLDCVIGAFIGVFMLMWFFVKGIWYIPLTIYRYIKCIKMS